VRWIKKRYKKRREYRYKHYDLGLPTKLNDEIEPHEKKDFELDFTSRETAEKEIINITMQELNQKLSIINRVVIHPKYRTIGLGAKLIRETLPLAGTPYVEMVHKTRNFLKSNRVFTQSRQASRHHSIKKKIFGVLAF